ncbi:hypothetical protein QP902_10020 [Corynebacterium marquesiae]|uniref:hypothetical protein n=1 Tax=Corynebacterium marquesiae TaxID=2913503 RepID=UPI002550776A|nr:hypothetical protein [Corynebacterium marquesiae]MDK8669007.1 hypothetical protein [Corynebacterium marquesiae]
MSIDYDQLNDLVTEMEQGVNATTKYSWLDLAEEILRMRDQLTAMKRPWFAIAIDPKRMAVEQDLATYVLEHIDHILGEAND